MVMWRIDSVSAVKKIIGIILSHKTKMNLDKDEELM